MQRSSCHTGRLPLTRAAISALFLTLGAIASAVWPDRYDGPAQLADFANDMVVDSSGNVYVAGVSRRSDGTSGFLTIKYNAAGTRLWVRHYRRLGVFAGAQGVAVDASGNVFVTGYVQVQSNVDITTIRYDQSGNLVWIRRFDGSAHGYDFPTDVEVDGSGNVYVTGESESETKGFNYATIKYGPSGVQQWLRTYDGPGNWDDVPLHLALDSNANVIVTGYSLGDTFIFDYATVKYSSAGERLWVRRYSGTGDGDSIARSVAIDENDNVVVTGHSVGASSFPDFLTIKYGADGSSQWVKRLHTADSESFAFDTAVDRFGNVYVTGTSGAYVDQWNLLTVKYDSNGERQWVRTHTGNKLPVWSEDAAFSIAVDESGNAYVAGYITGIDGDIDFATLKYSTAGERVWRQLYDGPSLIDYAVKVAVSPSGAVYVTGNSQAGNGHDDIVTLRY